ncbi:MAG: GMP synthase (glutamine-hydrolyzing) [Thermoanaerobaculia bacterium]
MEWLSYESIVALRAVTTEDFMTADWARRLLLSWIVLFQGGVSWGI